MNTADRIARYAFRFWKRAGMTEWPSVRQTARSLRITQGEVEDHSGDGPFFLTSYYTRPPEPLAEHFVEADTAEVEQTWEKYWSDWNASHGHTARA